MAEPKCTAGGGDHSSTYKGGHWLCYRCGYHGCFEGDCEPGKPVPGIWAPHGRVGMWPSESAASVTEPWLDTDETTPREESNL